MNDAILTTDDVDPDVDDKRRRKGGSCDSVVLSVAKDAAIVSIVPFNTFTRP